MISSGGIRRAYFFQCFSSKMVGSGALAFLFEQLYSNSVMPSFLDSTLNLPLVDAAHHSNDYLTCYVWSTLDLLFKKHPVREAPEHALRNRATAPFGCQPNQRHLEPDLLAWCRPAMKNQSHRKEGSHHEQIPGKPCQKSFARPTDVSQNQFSDQFQL